MSSWVVDASTALSWCFAEGSAPTPFGEITATIPGIWPLEVANGLLVGERRGRITRAQATRLIEALLAALEVHVDIAGDIFKDVLPLAREHGLSAYDAAYLELAVRRGMPLATADGKLAGATRRCGVAVIDGGQATSSGSQ